MLFSPENHSFDSDYATFATKAEAEAKLIEARWAHVLCDFDYLDSFGKWWLKDVQEGEGDEGDDGADDGEGKEGADPEAEMKQVGLETVWFALVYC